MPDFNIEDKISIVKDMLYGIAKFHGDVTPEEERIIETIAGDIHTYFELIASVLSKPKGPSSADRAKVFTSRLDIIKKTVNDIRADMKVTTDEKELFKAIQELLPGI